MSSMPSDGVTGDICPMGHYCPLGSTSPVVCPDGTYSNTTGIDNLLHGTASTVTYYDFKCDMQALIYYLFFFLIKGQKCVMSAPRGPTVYQEKVSSCVRQDTTVLVVVLRVFCPALLAHTALSLASAKWSSASFVQQVRVLSSGCLHCAVSH